MQFVHLMICYLVLVLVKNFGQDSVQWPVVPVDSTSGFWEICLSIHISSYLDLIGFEIFLFLQVRYLDLEHV